uniref:Chemokine interleukin-8-like domain-containing protein n=1 Tax=Cyprinus carpio carpio TaxID=630221 RepID=A0A9J8BE94_CYPCA
MIIEHCGLKDLPQHRPFSPAECFRIRSEQQNKMKFTLFAAFIFSVGWMSVVEAVVDGPPTHCCNTVTTITIPAANIVDYFIQGSVLCPVRAVRFLTKKNIVICSDPDSKWAKKVMGIVVRRKTTTPSQKPTTCYTSTTNVSPTVTTMNKTPGTETETSTSTTVTPAVTTIKTSGPETSTSTTVTPAVTTIKTSGQETSTSTTVTPAVTTIKTSGPETKISKTTIQQTSVSKNNPESTVITSGRGETTTPTTETKRETPGIGAVTTVNTFPAKNKIVNNTSHNHRTKPSKLKIKLAGKSKKRLRKVQINIKNKSG